MTWVHREAVMGTGLTVRIDGADPARSAEATSAATAWLHRVDATFSTYREDSQISRLGRGEIDLAACEPDVAVVLERCEELRVATDGAFDAWASGRLDPSGWVKGWAVDRASDLLVAAGCPDHLVECGGDVRLRGHPEGGGAWQVGVRHPHRLDAYAAALRIHGGAGVATSGTYERGWHVLDGRTGRPARGLAAVTVVGPELATADAAATAALALGADAAAWLAGLAGHEALTIDEAGLGWRTAGFAALEVELTGATRPRRPPGGQCTPRRSTTKTSVSPPLMTPPAPREP